MIVLSGSVGRKVQIKPIKAPLFSFFSADLYRSAARDWGGIAFGYLFLLVLAISIIYSIKLQFGLSDFVSSDFSEAFKKMPEFKVENGEFKCSESMPYLIKEPKTQEVIGVIDTRDNAEFPQDVKMKISKSEVSVKKSAFETRTFEFAKFPDFDKEAVKGFVETMALFLIPMFFVVWLFGSFVFACVQVLIYALIGMLFAKILKVELDYPALVRLAVVAVTPVLIIDSVMKLLAVEFPYGMGIIVWPLLTAAIALGYLFFGVKSNSSQTRGESPQVEASQ